MCYLLMLLPRKTSGWSQAFIDALRKEGYDDILQEIDPVQAKLGGQSFIVVGNRMK